MPQEDEYSLEDVYAIGWKVIEMAERAKSMHAACPGTRATWRFEIDDRGYCLTLTVQDEKGPLT